MSLSVVAVKQSGDRMDVTVRGDTPAEFEGNDARRLALEGSGLPRAGYGQTSGVYPVDEAEEEVTEMTPEASARIRGYCQDFEVRGA